MLEPGRTLTLPEKGGSEVEELVAHPNFLLLATMNPGGDFGKKARPGSDKVLQATWRLSVLSLPC